MILDSIVKSKKEEVEIGKERFPLNLFIDRLQLSERGFKSAISNSDLSVIAEIKRESPSEGIITTNFDFDKIALCYEQNCNVKALSILTDFPFFRGSLGLIGRAKRITSKPILRKDFIIDEYQIYESRLFEADAILLIARILTKKQIKKFIDIAKEYSMDSIVEIHSKEELSKIPDNAEIVGINNRDLDTFEINLGTTKELSKTLKGQSKIIVAESGIHTAKDVRFIKNNIDAMLVGTSILKSDNLDEKINSLFTPKIKICGITNYEDAKMSAELGADYLGFIFYKKSQRYISPEIVSKIVEKIKEDNKRIKFVGVFVNETLERIRQIYEDCALDFIQLHGDESEEFISQLNIPFIKAFRIKGDNDVEKINESSAKYVLLDTFHNELYGGTGQSFNWEILSKIKDKEIFLSGGINPDNVADAVKLKTFAIDVASGVEEKPGKKYHKKLGELFKALQ